MCRGLRRAQGQRAPIPSNRPHLPSILPPPPNPQPRAPQADMIIDETYYIGIPSITNISRSLGFFTLGDAQATAPAFAKQQVYRCECVTQCVCARVRACVYVCVCV